MKTASLIFALTLVTSTQLLKAEEGNSSLEHQMKILAKGNRQLTQQVTDSAQQQSSVDLIEKLKKAAQDSKSIDPRMVETIPSADKAKFLADYRAQMDKLSDAFTKIEEAVKAGNYNEAKSLLASVNSIKREGHEKFKQD
jgi:soluble cytochrome b562